MICMNMGVQTILQSQAKVFDLLSITINSLKNRVDEDSFLGNGISEKISVCGGRSFKVLSEDQRILLLKMINNGVNPMSHSLMADVFEAW
jgi:hypothetical protein